MELELADIDDELDSDALRDPIDQDHRDDLMKIMHQ
jgi:hypothetical protein